MAQVTILMGSTSDQEHVAKITKTLDEFDVSHQERIASAHKTPEKVLEIVAELEKSDCRVIIAVAGLSNAFQRNDCWKKHASSHNMPALQR